MSTFTILHKTDMMMDDINDELQRARKKFPSANYSMLALMEEVGELAQAKLKYMAAVQEWKTNENTMDIHNSAYSDYITPYIHAIGIEAVQVAVMAIRAVTEEDASMNSAYTEPTKSTQT